MAAALTETGERGRGALKFLDRWAGIPLTVPCSLFRGLAPRRAASNPPERIGVLCLGAIGDLLLVSALTDGIRRLFPGVFLDLIGSSANAAALPLNPHASAFFAAPVKSVNLLLRHLRESEYDILIDTSQWARLGNLLANLSGAGQTVGFATASQWRSLGYDCKVKHRADCHEIANFMNLGRALWPELAGAPSLALKPTHAAPDLVYCHMWPAPGKGRALKQWPETYWRDLIAILLARGCDIALTGGKADARPTEAFIQAFFPQSSRVVSHAGRAKLPELAVAMAASRAVISVNTGIMHLAAIAGAPTVGLHGATNPLRWGPVGEKAISLLPESGPCAYLNLGFEYPRGVKPAMHNLPVANVLAALEKLGAL